MGPARRHAQEGRDILSHVLASMVVTSALSNYCLIWNGHCKQLCSFICSTLNGREGQIKYIEETFRSARAKPVHPTKPNLQAVEVLPVLPLLDRLALFP